MEFCAIMIRIVEAQRKEVVVSLTKQYTPVLLFVTRTGNERSTTD